ncbi:MAG: D-alanyl-D-alanine carboxypeptidase [Gammaproteobacteria bacterium]|jgi:serine-type D-Ala-D-Ala carboxypeptidase (penicillin-binding protein 5/6)|nr:D-alanyl-D-alanine carboxypeptidase [Gammaproteobacteria bacterium]MBU2178797.1 D-alanyl-D-alanine carboxypeptidase [Gammaproteobacteria bacterium]MBU2280857.1 D-alanyl-D-alanine carboxypeptidase [Gammaproteobacteria bacterium]MBU2426230.1 D-alanyl-D-alanine carboxypeptidase [Gammaproteobacteria bacterium]
MNQYRRIFIATSFSCISFFASSQAVQVTPSAPEVNAKGFILIDYQTGKVLAEGNADTPLAPASLTKMMTSYVVGTEIKNGNIKPEDQVTISENAWAKKYSDSSKMFIEVGATISVNELNRGIIIQSGNDACVAIAEHIAGTEGAFVDLMNAHAKRLGMEQTTYSNVHGLPDETQRTTARDMSKLSVALIRDVPEEYKVYSEKEYQFNGIKQYNRNGLLWDKTLNVDGIKTGHTSEAGYSLITSATKDGMRLISVVMGTDSAKTREAENKKLLTYGFRFFETFSPYKAGEVFAAQRVWQGDKESINLGVLSETPITLQRGQRKNLKADFKLSQLLVAPIAKGQVVGTLYLKLGEEDIAEFPLVALEDIAEGTIFNQLVDYIKMQFL